VPIPSLRPTNIVFKGDEDFSYGHYGVHLGQTDRLVFIGPSRNEIKAYFIDCRAGSPTYKTRLDACFRPSSTQLLSIPPGVAHTFDTKAISTLNLFSMMLPDPVAWLSGTSQWTVRGDIVNLPMDVMDDSIPALKQNTQPASETFFKMIAAEQKAALGNLSHEYPFTQDIKFQDGARERLKFWKRLDRERKRPSWEPIQGIIGAGWEANLVVWTGDKSGYVPLLERRPKHMIDHGEGQYSHDAYGIHLGGDDHLVFIGPNDLKATCELVDCRRSSPTLHSSVTFEFSPDPLKTLVIPRGVAHRFETLQGIYTINQPYTYLPDLGEYRPGNDVLDWPIERRPLPVLDVNNSVANERYYEELSLQQTQMLAAPPTHATPSILLTADDAGNRVKVALRQRI
jgi:dTDP-4-dehydrorhamnose 3,5-epimerase-like enzyme